MRGTGFNTRMHATPKFDGDIKPNLIAEPASQGRRTSPHPRTPPLITHTENQRNEGDSLEHDYYSSYDSDDQTQIFYESTDEDCAAEEERAAAGTSVAEAVKDLNKKRTVAKVKHLFGI